MRGGDLQWEVPIARLAEDRFEAWDGSVLLCGSDVVVYDLYHRDGAVDWVLVWRQVVRLLAGEHGGSGAVVWDGRDARGAGAPAGTYFVRLTTPHAVRTCKVRLLR